MYKRGFHELPEQPLSGVSSPTTEVIGTNTNWLSWIQPTIFQTGHKQYDNKNNIFKLTFFIEYFILH